MHTYKFITNKNKKTVRVYEYTDGVLTHKYISFPFKYKHDFDMYVAGLSPRNFEYNKEEHYKEY